MKRTQERLLLKRKDDISVWEWALPLNAEPLLEFGSSHRIVIVKTLPGVLQTVGSQGIVGSQQEEKSRQALLWKEGDVVLVPSKDQQAVGYVHVQNPTMQTATATFASLIICKIPPSTSYPAQEDLLPLWHIRLRSLCRELMRELPIQTGTELNAVLLQESQAAVVRECVGYEHTSITERVNE